MGVLRNPRLLTMRQPGSILHPGLRGMRTHVTGAELLSSLSVMCF